jgi:hypothetical protein
MLKEKNITKYIWTLEISFEIIEIIEIFEISVTGITGTVCIALYGSRELTNAVQHTRLPSEKKKGGKNLSLRS